MSFFRKPEYEGKISFTEYISKEKKRWGFYSFHSIVTSLPEILTFFYNYSISMSLSFLLLWGCEFPKLWSGHILL